MFTEKTAGNGDHCLTAHGIIAVGQQVFVHGNPAVAVIGVHADPAAVLLTHQHHAVLVVGPGKGLAAGELPDGSRAGFQLTDGTPDQHGNAPAYIVGIELFQRLVIEGFRFQQRGGLMDELLDDRRKTAVSPGGKGGTYKHFVGVRAVAFARFVPADIFRGELLRQIGGENFLLPVVQHHGGADGFAARGQYAFLRKIVHIQRDFPGFAGLDPVFNGVPQGAGFCNPRVRRKGGNRFRHGLTDRFSRDRFVGKERLEQKCHSPQQQSQRQQNKPVSLLFHFIILLQNRQHTGRPRRPFLFPFLQDNMEMNQNCFKNASKLYHGVFFSVICADSCCKQRRYSKSIPKAPRGAVMRMASTATVRTR